MRRLMHAVGFALLLVTLVAMPVMAKKGDPPPPRGDSQCEQASETGTRQREANRSETATRRANCP